MTTCDSAFGMVLSNARERAGRSMADVARFLGVSVQYVSDVERGRRAPMVRRKLLDVARFLDVEPWRFLRAAAVWTGEVGLPVSVTDPRRDAVAAALAVKWEALPADAVERIAKEVGL
ncbi:hypothetical protein [Myxococcus phage Mx4 ts27htf-1hrm-1]|nr:hypothetical protein Mx4_p29 [Myxococcus phage Mx4]WNM70370.1 hypothetical protein [Myxococcus phage Mx4 ts27htf-1hrm-1]